MGNIGGMRQVADTSRKRQSTERAGETAGTEKKAGRSRKSPEEVEYYFYYLNSGGMTTSVSEALSGSSKTRSYDPAIKSETEYFSEKKWNSKKNWENINPTMEMANADQQKKNLHEMVG